MEDPRLSDKDIRFTASPDVPLSEASNTTEKEKKVFCLDGRAFLAEKGIEDLADRIVSEHGETLPLHDAVETCEGLFNMINRMPPQVARAALEAYLQGDDEANAESDDMSEENATQDLHEAKKKLD